MKKLLYLLLTCNIVFAYTYEHQMLQIHAKIAPRIILMSKNTRYSREENINIIIVYEDGDKNAANSFESYLNNIYPKGLNNIPLKIEKITYFNFKTAPQNSLIFLFDAQDANIIKVLKYCHKNKILTMSYSDKYLKYGVILSLHVGKNLKPYINLEAAKESNIIFKNNLISVSKLFHKER